MEDMRNRVRKFQSSTNRSRERGRLLRCFSGGGWAASTHGERRGLPCLHRGQIVLDPCATGHMPRAVSESRLHATSHWTCQGLTCKTKENGRRYLDLVFVIFSTKDAALSVALRTRVE